MWTMPDAWSLAAVRLSRTVEVRPVVLSPPLPTTTSVVARAVFAGPTASKAAMIRMALRERRAI
jgi:hypothetical protein